MFDEILKLVKDQLANDPSVTRNMAPQDADAMHHEIATNIHNEIQTASPASGETGGGILSQLQNGLAGGGMMTNALEGGLLGSLGSRFGLSPAITGAIAAALPGLIQKYAHKGAQPLAE